MEPAPNSVSARRHVATRSSARLTFGAGSCWGPGHQPPSPRGLRGALSGGSCRCSGGTCGARARRIISHAASRARRDQRAHRAARGRSDRRMRAWCRARGGRRASACLRAGASSYVPDRHIHACVHASVHASRPAEERAQERRARAAASARGRGRVFCNGCASRFVPAEALVVVLGLALAAFIRLPQLTALPMARLADGLVQVAVLWEVLRRVRLRP